MRPQPRHPDQQRPITIMQAKSAWCAPQYYTKLVAKKQVLGLKPPARLEQVDNEHPERVQNGKHRVGIMLRFCYVALIPYRIEFSEATRVQTRTVE
jgi:hypothetical protein